MKRIRRVPGLASLSITTALGCICRNNGVYAFPPHRSNRHAILSPPVSSGHSTTSNQHSFNSLPMLMAAFSLDNEASFVSAASDNGSSSRMPSMTAAVEEVSVSDIIMNDLQTIGIESTITNTIEEDPIQTVMDNTSSTLRSAPISSVVNYTILTTVTVAALSILLTVDLSSGVTRGWTSAEIAYRIPLDDWARYNDVLHRFPILTKAATSATVYAIGDMIAQRTEGTTVGNLDRGRTLRSLLAGLVGHGPMSHAWYNLSEGFFTDVLHWTDWWSFIPKVGLDQGVFGPVWNSSYILLLGLMKGNDIQNIWSEMKRSTVPLIVSGLKLWPLVHCVTYGLIPVENRVLWVDAVEILWVTILATQAAGGGDGASDGGRDIGIDVVGGEETQGMEKSAPTSTCTGVHVELASR